MSRTLINSLECPLCGGKVPELVDNIEEGLREQIIAAVKQKKPEWVLKNGVCVPCLNYFQNLVTKPSKFKKLKGKLQNVIARQHHKMNI